jgi:hypothetical protein
MLAAKTCINIAGLWFEQESIFTCQTEDNFGIDIYFGGDVTPFKRQFAVLNLLFLFISSYQHELDQTTLLLN